MIYESINILFDSLVFVILFLCCRFAARTRRYTLCLVRFYVAFSLMIFVGSFLVATANLRSIFLVFSYAPVLAGMFIVC